MNPVLSFSSDYEEGAAPQILSRLTETNLEKTPGYGSDSYSASAREKIRNAISCPGAQIAFLTGGTQTNQIAIDLLLSPWQGVLSADTGHIALHEAGAIEFTGHKVLTLPQTEGKICAQDVQKSLTLFYGDENHEHMVMPGLVYISQPSEYGTLYSLEELKDLRKVCDGYGLSLYVDGARLAYALACPENDVTLPDLADLTDAFYIGGTKCGALFGEALIFPDENRVPHLLTRIKQHGALLAKGRIPGIMFDTLFTDDLYLRLGKNAIDTASLLRDKLRSLGYHFFFETSTNQIFLLLEDEHLNRIKRYAAFSFWEKPDEKHTVVRLATSWATTREQVQSLIDILSREI